MKLRVGDQVVRRSRSVSWRADVRLRIDGLVVVQKWFLQGFVERVVNSTAERRSLESQSTYRRDDNDAEGTDIQYGPI